MDYILHRDITWLKKMVSKRSISPDLFMFVCCPLIFADACAQWARFPIQRLAKRDQY